MNFRKPYDYDVKAASDDTAIPTIGPSLTVQSQSEDADINVLMARYGITGKFPDNPLVPTYSDYSNIGDFRSALHAIQNASEAFMQYPASFRARFDNDPQKFLLFSSDVNNIPEMKKLGMFKPEVDYGLESRSGATQRAEGGAPSGSGTAQSATASGKTDANGQSSGPGGQTGSTPIIQGR